MFRAFHNELPSNLQNRFKPNVSVYDTRQNDSFCTIALKVNDNLKTTDHDKTNALNNHFKSVFTNEQRPIPTKGPS